MGHAARPDTRAQTRAASGEVPHHGAGAEGADEIRQQACLLQGALAQDLSPAPPRKPPVKTSTAARLAGWPSAFAVTRVAQAALLAAAGSGQGRVLMNRKPEPTAHLHKHVGASGRAGGCAAPSAHAVRNPRYPPCPVVTVYDMSSIVLHLR